MIKKIISGRQTGADQAALDAAIQWRIPHGGRIPKESISDIDELDGENEKKAANRNLYATRKEKGVNYES